MPELPERSRPRRQWRGSGSLGNLLRDPALAINEIVSERLADLGYEGFRTAHGTIGQHIADGGSRVTELAQLAQVSKPTVVYLVNDLERLGYVERVPDPADGRAEAGSHDRARRRGAAGGDARSSGRSSATGARCWGRGSSPSCGDHLQRLHDALWPRESLRPA